MPEAICIGGSMNRKRLSRDDFIARIPITKRYYNANPADLPHSHIEIEYEEYRLEEFYYIREKDRERLTWRFWVRIGLSHDDAFRMIIEAY